MRLSADCEVAMVGLVKFFEKVEMLRGGETTHFTFSVKLHGQEKVKFLKVL